MKTLPDNPHLDHLRQQAKDLLAGLRDADPSVSLAQAQTALAKRYGFRAWPDLKAEVERMRGRVDVLDDTLAREIAARYGLGQVIGAARSVARTDVDGRRWSLETDRGRWAVRTMDTWIPIVDAETDVALQEAAAAAGVSLPAPVRSGSGAVIERIGGHPWRVNEWLPSGPSLVAPVSSTITRRVGEILATIHRLGVPVDRVSPWHASRLSPVSWSDLAARARAERAGWATALEERIPVLTDLETLGEGGSAPEPVLCHNNLTPGNVRTGRGGHLIVMGWEHAGGQPPAWELCEALTLWAVDPDGGVNIAGARALVTGYRAKAGSLPPLDLSTFRGVAIGLANYVYELAEGALNATEPDDRGHADRSVRHMLAHLPTRATLERLLDAVVVT